MNWERNAASQPQLLIFLETGFLKTLLYFPVHFG